MRIRDKFKITQVNVSDIQPEIVPLSQEKQLKQSLFYDEETPQYEEIKLVELENNDYKYRVINGRRRVETYRQENPNSTIRAIVLKNISEQEIHWGALLANSGTANYAGEAEHFAYLRQQGWKQKELAKKTGYSIGKVNGRLRLYDDLIPVIFQLLKNGGINFSCAWECTKLSKDQQEELIIFNAGKKLTPKIVKEFYREQQAEQIEQQPHLIEEFEMDDIPNGLFLTHEQMTNIIEGDSVWTEYMNKKIHIVGHFV